MLQPRISMDIIQPLDFCSFCCNVMVTAWKTGSKQNLKTPFVLNLHVVLSLPLEMKLGERDSNLVETVHKWFVCSDQAVPLFSSQVSVTGNLNCSHCFLWFFSAAFGSSGRDWPYSTRRKVWKCWEISWIYLFK